MGLWDPRVHSGLRGPMFHVGLWGLCRAMGSMWGYGVCMRLWGLYEAMGSVWGNGVHVGLWGLYGAVGYV